MLVDFHTLENCFSDICQTQEPVNQLFEVLKSKHKLYAANRQPVSVVDRLTADRDKFRVALKQAGIINDLSDSKSAMVRISIRV